VSKTGEKKELPHPKKVKNPLKLGNTIRSLRHSPRRKNLKNQWEIKKLYGPKGIFRNLLANRRFQQRLFKGVPALEKKRKHCRRALKVTSMLGSGLLLPRQASWKAQNSSKKNFPEKLKEKGAQNGGRGVSGFGRKKRRTD